MAHSFWFLQPAVVANGAHQSVAQMYLGRQQPLSDQVCAIEN
jgi:hypothetical protein